MFKTRKSDTRALSTTGMIRLGSGSRDTKGVPAGQIYDFGLQQRDSNGLSND